MMDIINSIVSLIIADLFEEEESRDSNVIYWNKVVYKDHGLSSSCQRVYREIKDAVNSVKCKKVGDIKLLLFRELRKKYREYFRKKTPYILETYLRNKKTVASAELAKLVFARHGVDVSKLKEDLTCRNSVIFDVLSDIFQVHIYIHRGNKRSLYRYSPKADALRERPIGIEWNKESQCYERVSSKLQREVFPIFKRKAEIVEIDEPIVKKKKFTHVKEGDKSKDVSKTQHQISHKKHVSFHDKGVYEKRLDKIDELSKDLSLSEDEDIQSIEDKDDKNSDTSSWMNDDAANCLEGLLELGDIGQSQSPTLNTPPCPSSDNYDPLLPNIDFDSNTKDLFDIPMANTLFDEKTKIISKNLDIVVDISERLKNHAQVLQRNVLSSNMSDCISCMVHCIPATDKATKGKRGPRKK